MTISFPHFLVLLSAAINVLGASFYIRDTLKGKTKPNRVSWSMWAFVPLLATMAALSAKADPWATLRIFLAGFLPLIILIASFINRKSYWEVTRFDFLCGASSLVAIALWIILDSPRTAILFAVIADGFASLPTLSKAWKFPETETGTTYIASLISVLMVIPSIPVWNIENSAFQIYLFIMNVLLIFFIYRKRWGRA